MTKRAGQQQARLRMHFAYGCVQQRLAGPPAAGLVPSGT